MEFCAEHWQELQDEIKRVGLGDLVSKDGEQVATRQFNEFNEGMDWSNFDPLMGAHWAIVGNVARIFGNPLVVIAHDGCPLCLLIDEHAKACKGEENCVAEETYRSWPRRAAEDAKDRWQELTDKEIPGG